MYNDVLMAFLIFQAVFFFLDIYIYAKSGRDIARKGEYTFFCALIITHLVYLVLNSTWSLQEYGVLHLSKSAMTLVCMGSYLAITSCSFIFFRFTIERIRFYPIRKASVQLLFLLPGLLSGMLILLSPWNGLVFHLDEANTIVQGPAYLIMMISATLYLLAVVAIALYNIFTVKTKMYRLSSAALLVSVLIIIGFVFLDNLLPKVSILPVAVFAVILVIFINMQVSNINTDALTGLFNRRMADEYLQKQLTEVSEKEPLFLYICDLNDFKKINDTYGHMEGDQALQLCGEVLKNATLPISGFAARFGGDEFLMCWQPIEEEPLPDPDVLTKKVAVGLDALAEKQGKPYRLSLCVGYAVCADKEETLQECIRRADKMQYVRKQEYHAQKTGR